MKRTYHHVTWTYNDGDWFASEMGAEWKALSGTDRSGRTVAFTLLRNGEIVRVKTASGREQWVQGRLRDLSRWLWRVREGSYRPTLVFE